MKELFEYIRDWILYYCGWVRYIHCALHGHNFYHCHWLLTESRENFDQTLIVRCENCGEEIKITIDGSSLIRPQNRRRTW